MELLLNLAWILLALPAYWLWRVARNQRDATPLQCLLALGCMLVLLFPVISATDDLHPMRAEMEDSSVSKRTVRQAAGERSSAWVNRLQISPALLAGSEWMPAPQISRFEFKVVRAPALAARSLARRDRAPPVSFLG